MPRLAALAALLALLLVAGPSRSLRAEEPAAPAERAAAAARAQAVCAALPAPSEARAFRFEGEYVMKDQVLGPAVVALAAGSEGETAVWTTLEEITLNLGPNTMVVRLEAVLDARLDAQSGRSVSEIGAESRVEVTWKREGAGYQIARQVHPPEEASSGGAGLLAAPLPLKASLTGLIAFCRALPPETQTYALEVLDTEPNMGSDPAQRLRRTTLEVLGEQPWSANGTESPAWVVRRQDEGRDPVLLAFTRDPARHFIGLKSPERRLELRLKAGALPGSKPPLPPVVPARPAAPAAPGTVDGDAPDPAVVAASAALRAALPAPVEGVTPPSVFEGDLVFQGARLGSVSLRAEAVTRAGKPCWHVVERTVREAGKGRVVQELSAFLAPDLSLIQGESVYRSPSGGSVTSFGRREGRLEVVESQDGGASRTVTVDVPADASMGLWAVSRLVGALQRAQQVAGWLPVFDPRFAFPDDHEQAPPPGLADLRLESVVAQDQGLYEEYELTARSGRHLRVRPGAGDGLLARVEGVRPAVDIVPAGAAGPLKAPDWFERIGEPPLSALQAFCAFGRGYHLPRRDLLESSFHWPSMLAHEVQAGTFPQGTKDAQVRAYYVAEFEGMSKHRTEADCDDLLVQLLTSATITTSPDGSVTVASLPVFGGHAYTMRPVDGRWFIVALD